MAEGIKTSARTVVYPFASTSSVFNKKLELMEDMYAQSSVTANKRATVDFDHNARKMEKQMKALIEKVHGVLEVEFRHFWYICDRSLSFFYVFTVD